MCGIVGVAGHVTEKDHRAFRQLLTVGVLRGPHGTGVVLGNAPNNNDEEGITSWWIKAPDTPESVLEDVEFIKTITDKKRSTHFMIGHNRWATSGDPDSDRDTHPFEFGPITGVHNGTVPRWVWENLPGISANKDEVYMDSQAIYASLHKNGLEKTVAHLCQGALALVWWDDSDKTLNFFRNEERPLSLTTANKGKTIYWASEPKMLEWILDRNDIIHGDVVSLNTMTHLVFRFDDKNKLQNPEITVCNPEKVYPNYIPKKESGVYGSAWWNFYDDYDDDTPPFVTNPYTPNKPYGTVYVDENGRPCKPNLFVKECDWCTGPLTKQTVSVFDGGSRSHEYHICEECMTGPDAGTIYDMYSRKRA